MGTLQIKAYAKVNPLLRVGPKRPDGYHCVQAVLQAVDLHDVVTFHPAEVFAVECSLSELAGEANLAAKAARLLSELIDLPSVRVFIEKRIPLQAGLGGGSSDAAALIQGLRLLTEDAVSVADCLAVAAACGVDTPFFLLDATRARAEGKGDRLTPLPPLAERRLVLAKPAEGVCTAEAYAALDSLWTPAWPPPACDEGPNDLEQVAPEASKELLTKMSQLGAVTARLRQRLGRLWRVCRQAERSRGIRRLGRRGLLGKIHADPGY